MNQIVPFAPAMTVSDVERVALAIARGGLFGSKDPNAVLTLCLLAQAEGQHPAVVFRDYHLINGKPAKKAEAMLRDFVSAGGRVEWHELSDTTADATFSHPGGGSARIDWTLERARAAGIANPMWKKYPRQMLRSRVVSEGVRTVFPGATSGLYVPEEIADMGPAQAEAPAEPEALEVEARTVSEPASRQKLEGPCTSATALRTALKEFVRSLEGSGTIDDLNDLIADPETAAILEQCERDLPGWWSTGEGLPAEFQPLKFRIDQRRRDLEDIAHLDRGNTRTILDAG